jgi:hypothetical protein
MLTEEWKIKLFSPSQHIPKGTKSRRETGFVIQELLSVTGKVGKEGALCPAVCDDQRELAGTIPTKRPMTKTILGIIPTLTSVHHRGRRDKKPIEAG